jgi:hypothetical protein
MILNICPLDTWKVLPGAINDKNGNIKGVYTAAYIGSRVFGKGEW